MKKITLIMMVAIGLTILLFTAFKNEAPKKGYAIVTTQGMVGWVLYKEGGDKIKIESVGGNFETNQVSILNNLAKEGWELKTVIAMGTNAGTVELYMERVKP
jgi:hypothetical protein